MTDLALPPRIEAPSAGARIALVDVARGVAILAMVVFHFTWDLSLNGLISLNPQVDPAWQWFARLIAGTFLALVGVSLVLSARRGIRWDSFLRRLGIIAGSALLVSAVTWLMAYLGILPGFVYFGILHAIALLSLAALLFLRLPVIVVEIAAGASFAAPAVVASSFFDFARPLLNALPLVWLGLAERVPPAVDYVPFFPWFGATLTGIVLARLALAWRPDAFWARWSGGDAISRLLVTAGRWSLVIYLIHQPLLFALTSAIAQTPPGFELRTGAQVRACEASCVETGDTAAFCSTYCGCVFDELRSRGLLERVVNNRMSAADELEASTITLRCLLPSGTTTPPQPPPLPQQLGLALPVAAP